MACVEDCDQILIASTIKDSQGWEENGNSSTVLCWCSFVVYILISESFQNDDDESVDWGGASLGSRERGEWGSWEEGEPHSEASTATVGENVFDIMRDGSLSQVEKFINKYGLDYTMNQRDEYGHTPTHWLALNGHTHVFR